MENVIKEGVKSTNNAVGDLTLDQFKNAIANNLEVKGYYDSLIDKTVAKRLDKGIDAWKEQNIESLINEEINKRYPQKTEQEIEFENKQQELDQAISEKKQLELQIKYQNLVAESEIPLEMINFVAGEDVESTMSNIETFKKVMAQYVDKEVSKRFLASSYVPPGTSPGHGPSVSSWESAIKEYRR